MDRAIAQTQLLRRYGKAQYINIAIAHSRNSRQKTCVMDSLYSEQSSCSDLTISEFDELDPLVADHPAQQRYNLHHRQRRNSSRSSSSSRQLDEVELNVGVRRPANDTIVEDVEEERQLENPRHEVPQPANLDPQLANPDPQLADPSRRTRRAKILWLCFSGFCIFWLFTTIALSILKKQKGYTCEKKENGLAVFLCALAQATSEFKLLRFLGRLFSDYLISKIPSATYPGLDRVYFVFVAEMIFEVLDNLAGGL